MDYADWQTYATTMLEVQLVDATSASPTSDPNYNAIYPNAITYTEQRIQQDIDLLATLIRDPNGTTSANTRSITLPTDMGAFIVVQQVALIVGGVRQAPMLPVSRDFLDATYPSEIAPSSPSYPQYWSTEDGSTVLSAPPADQAYPVEVVGNIRVTPLSATNTSNWLTENMADLYVAASLVYLSAYRRDFGAQSSDPQVAQSWENQYQARLKAYNTEELRKKFQSQAWTYRTPNPLAQQT